MYDIGRTIITIGFIIIIIGIIVSIGSKLGLGKLPGDIVIKKGNFTFFFPVITSIVLSIILTVILNIIRKFF
ncbi:DUF2905 domain-containing protein [Clostridium sp. D2Q-11]|uniref:DUF2905 domain-containing protein n=1 Tax=Anaeromonas frigoriresistens TaxID=2683708 RepID=A0A942Z8D4_9FIRM|nr:DUF2905 domain-containing protein [Anaeromonas frigoriresistens]MBS4539677.1 DUF2905 domain-containing protein [Anaeromonas frigoriresistens]